MGIIEYIALAAVVGILLIVLIGDPSFKCADCGDEFYDIEPDGIVGDKKFCSDCWHGDEE